MTEVVITNALRTPIGKFLGDLSSLKAVDLGVDIVRALLEESKLDPAEVDEVLMGQGRQLGSGPNPGRQVSIGAGIPHSVPAMTLNKACGSSLKAISQGRDSILLGNAKIIIAGGMESMSTIPFLLPGMRQGYRLGHRKALDGNYEDGFNCPLVGAPMGLTAEFLADRYEISREEQDAYALQSFHKLQAAEEAGKLFDERVPVEVKGRKGEVKLVETDGHARKDLKMEDLAKLRPVFRENGTVHAGNSSGITDGASAVLMMTREEAEKRGLEILARVGPAKVAGVDPRYMGIGPVPAVRKLCAQLEKTVDDFDLIELNEAFAAQVIACDRELHLPMERVNVNGGAIALGHPIGATGARIVATLLHEMKRRDAKLGMATLCMSGGMGMAVAFER
ncbi:MAG TPA: thiolase family protein [Planctomycetes bacterium]|nr:thiolase family protein [Planctomycetota bacterium]